MIVDPEDILTRYDVSSCHGFLPDNPPLLRLPHTYYNPWEIVMDELPSILALQRVRKTIDDMPVLQTTRLSSEREWMRAYVVLSFMTHAYIWGDTQPSQALPPSICSPYLEVSEHFGLPSTATYAAFNLWNWTPKLPGADITLPENVRMMHTFTNTVDEEWFYAISVSIEAEGAKIIPTMLECFVAVQNENSIVATQLIDQINDRITRLGCILDRMHEKCDPYVFYHRIRPLLAGSKGMATAGLPKGVFYDEGQGRGVWRQYSGGSNAQSSLIQLLDIMLGVKHHATDSAVSRLKKSAIAAKQGYIEEMRRYMPKKHRRFLQHVAESTNIQAYATRHDVDASFRRAYTRAVDSLTLFRDKHIQIVARYIIAPSRQLLPGIKSVVTNIATTSMQLSTDESLEQKQLCGTGGTNLMPFLKQTRDETKRAGIFTENPLPR